MQIRSPRFFAGIAGVLLVGLAGSLSAPTLIAGCSSNSPGGGDGTSSTDAKLVLADLSNNVILPTYRALDTETGALRDAAEALRSAPSADALARAQSAWRAARKSWHRAEAFRFGPVEAKELSDQIHFWPANGSRIEQFIAGGDPLTADSLGRLGANMRGFMGLEYLLFDNGGEGDAGILAKLTGEGAAERRRTYVALAAANLKAKTEELLRAWEPTGENFAGELTNAGGSSGTFPNAKSAIDTLVNSATFAGELVANTKIAKPLGLKEKGVVQPAQEETPRSDNSIADMLATLDGVRSVYDGTYGGVDGKGIGDLVRPKNAALDDRLHAALADSVAKIQAVPAPFRTALTAQPAPINAAYESAKSMKNVWQTEIASMLGTTLKFNDNDGD